MPRSSSILSETALLMFPRSMFKAANITQAQTYDVSTTPIGFLT